MRHRPSWVFRAPLCLRHLAPHWSSEMLPACWGERRRTCLSLSMGAGVPSGVCPRMGKCGRFRHWERVLGFHCPWEALPVPQGDALIDSPISQEENQ